MGTRTLMYMKSVLILQVVSSVYSIHDGPQYKGWTNEVDHNIDHFTQERKPMFRDAVEVPKNYDILDDVYESQLPAPLTQEDMPEDTSCGDHTIDDANRGSPEDDRNVLSGSYNLKTNEIIKNPNAFLKKRSFSNSNSKQDGNTGSVKKELTHDTSKLYNFSDLDKAVENAVSNLPSSDESPLVPLIKIYKERVDQESDDDNGDPERQAERRFLRKRIILKLAKEAQSQKEAADIRKENKNVQESQVEEQKKEEDAAQVKNLDENSEDDQPCDCGCDEEEPQDQAKSGDLSEQGIQSGDEDQQTNIPANTMVILRKTNSETTEREDMQGQPWKPFSPSRDQPWQRLQLHESSPLVHILLRVSSSKIASTKTIPSSQFDENKNILQEPREQLNSGMEGCGDGVDKDESSQVSNRSSSSRVSPDEDVSESSDENERASNTIAAATDRSMKNRLFPDIKAIQYHQRVPNELLLLKHLVEIMKEKAALNALRRGEERQLPQLSPFTTSKLVFIRHNNPLSESNLPPKYFLDNNSGYKIKQVDDPQAFLNNKKLKAVDSYSKIKPRLTVQLLNNVQEVDHSDAFAQQPSKPSPQEIPLFIRHLIANLQRPVREGSYQPTPATYFTHFPENF